MNTHKQRKTEEINTEKLKGGNKMQRIGAED